MSGKGAKGAGAGAGAKKGGAAAPKAGAKGAAKKGPQESVLFPSEPKSFKVGGDTLPRNRDLSRFVKWPRNVRLQRQRKILYQRLKVPPAINAFRKPLDKAEAHPLFTLLGKYRPETAAAKTERIRKQAEDKAAGKTDGTSKAPAVLQYGLNHITYLVEQRKTKLVVIASDVDPIELVVWLPALCRKMGVPYVIVNNKGRLGELVHQKKATALALTAVNKEDEAALGKAVEVANAKFRDNADLRRKWGGGVMGLKTQRKLEQRERAIAAELAKKAML